MVEETGLSNIPNSHLPSASLVGQFEDTHKKESMAGYMEDNLDTFDNTLGVLRLYSKLIKVGHYFIVEDGVCHHGLEIGPDPGPYEAVEAFIRESGDFEIDRSRERFLLTWNPKGYLRRTKA